MVFGEFGRGVSFAGHGLPLTEHLNSVQLMVSGGCCGGSASRHGLLDMVKKHMETSKSLNLEA